MSPDTAARPDSHGLAIDTPALSRTYAPASRMHRSADMLLALIPGLVAIALFVATLTLKRAPRS